MADGVSFSINNDKHAKAMSFLASMRRAGPKVVIRELNGMLSIWQREIVRHIPVDNGIARASIQVRKAEQDDAGRIGGAVGTNVDYVKYLELGFEKATGLFKAVYDWKLGQDPIIHWAAKDGGIDEIKGKLSRARSDKSRLNYERRIAKAESPMTQEFAPPFRGSWNLIADRLVDRLRNGLAKLMKTGKLDAE